MLSPTNKAVLKPIMLGRKDVHHVCVNGRSALWEAAALGNLAVVVHLAGEGASLSQNDKYARSPLWAAACNDHLDVVKWLANRGASVTQVTLDGSHPVHIAAQNGHLAVVRWLANHGGYAERPSNTGATPLYTAARSGRLAVVRWLAAHGASINRPAASGATPLWVAGRFGHLAVVQWLAGHGAASTGYGPIFHTLGVPVRCFLDAAKAWSPFTILVACRLVDDAKRALESGRPDLTCRHQLVAISESRKDALWPTSPDVCPAMAKLARDAIMPWSSERHFLFHPGVRNHVRIVLLVAGRQHKVHAPSEMWLLICSFFSRADWALPPNLK